MVRCIVPVPTLVPVKVRGNVYQQPRSNIEIRAYSHYLLARLAQGQLSQLRYFSSRHKTDLSTFRSAALIGAAFAHYGDSKNAQYWFKTSLAHLESKDFKNKKSFDHFGSPLRDFALVLKLLLETTESHPAVPKLVALMADHLHTSPYLSTQEKAWLLIVSNMLHAGDGKIDIRVNGETFNDTHPYQSHNLNIPVKVLNQGDKGLWASVSFIGAPKTLLPAESQGFNIQRQVYTLDGKKVNLNALTQGNGKICFFVFEECRCCRQFC